MFNSRRIEKLEQDVIALHVIALRQNEALEKILKDFCDAPVSPAKPPEKKNRKYIKSGKYAKKVTTKKK